MPAERPSISSWSTCGQRWIALPPSARVRPGSRWSSMRPGAAATAVGKDAAGWNRRDRKQVEQYATRRSGHGSRQERGEMEQAGRILRAQASRKQVFQTILPLLSAGLIRPAEGKRPARKDERLIR